MSLPGHPGQQALLQYADHCHLIGLSLFILDEPTWAPWQQALLQYADRCHLIGLSLFILDEPTWAPWATGIITVCRPLSYDWIITIHTR